MASPTVRLMRRGSLTAAPLNNAAAGLVWRGVIGIQCREMIDVRFQNQFGHQVFGVALHAASTVCENIPATLRNFSFFICRSGLLAGAGVTQQPGT
jgi:hypothetical protein